MKKPCAVTLLLALAGAPVVAASSSEAARWEQLGWSHVSSEPLHFERLGANATHRFEPTLVMFEGSGWTEADIAWSMKKVSAIYAQCGVRVGVAELVTAVPPGGSADISKDRDLFLSEHTPASAPRPVIYFVGKASDNTASYSYHRGHCNDASCDTVWMLASVNAPQYRLKRAASYNPLAHELLHVFAQEDHKPLGVEEDNLLGFYSDLRKDRISESQCAKVRAHPAMSPAR